MTETVLPAWVAIPAAILLVAGGLLTLIGSIGVLRMRDFYTRMHPPTMGATLGVGCVLIASMFVSSVVLHRLVIHEVVIAVLMILSAPVTAMLLMQAGMSRDKRRPRSEPPPDQS